MFAQLARRIEEINRANGWDALTPDDWDRAPQKVASKLALLHSEISEALEAYRRGDLANFVEELGDVVIRVLDTTFPLAIPIDESDVEGAMGAESDRLALGTFAGPLDRHAIPAALNHMHSQVTWSRQYRHTTRITFGDHMAGLVADARTIAMALDVDLDAAIDAKLEKNAARGHRHGGKVV